MTEITVDYAAAKRQMLHYFDEELFLDLEASDVVDWDWLARAVVDAALGLAGDSL